MGRALVRCFLITAIIVMAGSAYLAIAMNLSNLDEKHDNLGNRDSSEIQSYLLSKIPKDALSGYKIIPRGGIPEANISEEELLYLLKSARVENFMDPITREFDDTKLKNFKDPVTMVVERLKDRGYSGDEIAEILKRYNMFYDPETGATGIGIKLPSNLEDKLPTRRFQEPGSSSGPWSAKMITNYSNYRGINTNIQPGSMAIKQGETFQHVVTTHVGKPYLGNDYWVEVGVFRDLGFPDWWLFTYDNDEGGYNWHGIITGEQNLFKNYIIYVYNTKDESGYKYGVWIEGEWRRDGHLPWRENYVDEAKEVWSDTGKLTDDTERTFFEEPFLYYGDGAIWWNDEVPTDWWPKDPDYPVKQKHYIPDGGSAWTFETWVQT